MSRLEKAIQEFEDSDSDLTLADRIAGLREALMWNAFDEIKLINKEGVKREGSEEAEEKQKKCMESFKILEKMYLSGLKSNKIEGKSDDTLDREFIQKMKQSQGSLGSIVIEQKMKKDAE